MLKNTLGEFALCVNSILRKPCFHWEVYVQKVDMTEDSSLKQTNWRNLSSKVFPHLLLFGLVLKFLFFEIVVYLLRFYLEWYKVFLAFEPFEVQHWRISKWWNTSGISSWKKTLGIGWQKMWVIQCWNLVNIGKKKTVLPAVSSQISFFGQLASLIRVFDV